MGELLDWANAGSKQLRSGAVPSSDDDNMPLSQRMLASSDDTELDASDGRLTRAPPRKSGVCCAACTPSDATSAT